MCEKCSPSFFFISLTNMGLSFMQQSDGFFQIDVTKCLTLCELRYKGVAYNMPPKKESQKVDADHSTTHDNEKTDEVPAT